MNETEIEINEKHTGQKRMAVAVLGASAKPARYSNQALRLLSQQGYTVYPVHPTLSEIEGLPVCRHLTEVASGLDTVTVYLSPERSDPLCEELLRAQPRRIIFNPGAENPALAETLRRAGIEVLNACTLVMLRTGQFNPARPVEPVRTSEACIPCLLRQAREAITLTRQTPEKSEVLYRRILVLLSSCDWRACPPVLSQKIQRLLRERTGCEDPYWEMKAELNREALKQLPEVKKRIPPDMDQREAAVRLAIAGNILDAGAKSGLELAGAMRALGEVFNQPLDGDWKGFFQAAAEAENILYLADNAGEIVFDRCLLEKLPPGKVTVAVRGKPVLNDATLEDAESTGLSELAAIISNGSDAPGTVLEDCSPAFLDAYAKSDLVIAKGQGNYETLAATDQCVYFLFQVKCPVIAKRVGAPVGTLVVRGQER